MKVAVINEVSACSKNADIIRALEGCRDVEILNIGMKDPAEEHPLTYIQTGIMSAILLNTGVCDLAVGGCGTGQGYLNAVMQFPNIVCGLIQEPLDAWLFSQINGGNCISLALNKGYGWAGDKNLQDLFLKLFQDPMGGGYPSSRKESQKQSRELLKGLSKAAHKSLEEILNEVDWELLKPVTEREDFMELLKEEAAAVYECLKKRQKG